MSSIPHRYFIMYEALAKREPFEAYKKFCKVIKDANFNYPDYEYWYYRFYNGNVDVNYDRNSDPKQATICELPNEMLGEVMQYLDFQNRAQVRKVCKKFRASIDQIKTNWENVSIEINHEWIQLTLDPYVIEYLPTGTIRLGARPRKQLYVGEWLDYAFGDMELYLRSGKVQIQNLNIQLSTTPGIANRLIRVFKSSVENSGYYYFHVENAHFTVNNVAHPPRILSSFKPRILQTIQIESPNGKGDVRKLTEMEHFKQADLLSIKTFATVPMDLFRQFYHLRKFTIRMEPITGPELMEMTEGLSKQSIFEECRLHFPKPPNLAEILPELGAPVIAAVRKGSRHIRSLENGLQIEFDAKQIRITSKRLQQNQRMQFSDDSSDDE